MKKFLLLLVLALPGGAWALYEDVTAERFPDADVVQLKGIDEITYQPDGTYTSRSENYAKVLTENGRREEGIISVRFNARYGRAYVSHVSIIAPDGTVREVDVSATTKEATDNSSADANIYDPMDRVLTCTIPGVQVGDVIRSVVVREMSKSRIEDQFAGMYMMAWSCPILEQQVTIHAPAAKPLENFAVRHPLGNVTYTAVTNETGAISHTWAAKNSPQLFPEPDMPPLYTQIQHVRVSTAKDWRTLSRWYWDLSAPHLEKTTPAITNQVNAIGKDIAKLFKWVSQEIRYMGLTFEEVSPGYAPHDVDVTFDHRYGVCRDKAGLLVAMLRIAGFEAYPVLIHNGAKMDPEVPSPFFNHAIVCVKAPGDPRANKDGYILMDPTDESSRDLLPAYLSDKSYLVACPEGETLLTSQVPTAAENAVKVRSKGILEADGAVLLETVVDFGGINDNAYRQGLLRYRRDERRKFVERLVRAVAPGAELLTCEFSPTDLRETETPLSIKFAFRAPESLLLGETRDELVVPLLSRGFGFVNWMFRENTSLATRQFPLRVESTAMTDEVVEIKLGDMVGKTLFLPEDIEVLGSYSYRRAYAVENQVLTVKRSLSVNTVEFLPRAYEALCDNIKKVEAAERARPIFAKDEERGAGVHIKRTAKDYHFTSPTAWVMTNTVEKTILTYEGKKSSSELKYLFNPTWQQVDVIEATVTSPAGKVSKLTDKEKNLFDCGWAAKSPRYPASRELVVNLPSVEIGSTIAYTTVTTVTNAPTAYYGTFYFDAFEPVDEIDVRWGERPEEHRIERDVKRLKVESMQAPGLLWRDAVVVAKGDFKAEAQKLQKAVAVKACPPASVGLSLQTVQEIRDWMSRHIRVAGPSLYEVPLEQQLTEPQVVLTERYATRLDYVRTLCALLKGAGYKADIVFAANDKGRYPALQALDRKYPDITQYAAALCRVKVKSGGRFGFGGRTQTFYLGLENEYTPLGATSYADCRFVEPLTGRIGTVTTADDLKTRQEECYRLQVQESGAVDVAVTTRLYGPDVGSFRKKYAEMLPEDKSRHYQNILSGLAQAATSTRELEADIQSYPAKLSYAAQIPDYAVVEDGAISLNVPAIAAQLFPLTGSLRETPMGVAGLMPSKKEIIMTFPKGYTVVEHLPQAYTFAQPGAADAVWYHFTVKSAVTAEGQLEVTLTREAFDSADAYLPREYFALLKDWNRLATSRANRTIIVRKANESVK